MLSVGDENFRQKCQAKIEELLKNGTTLIYVSHNMDEVKRLCKKALWIKGHKAFMYGGSSEIVDKYIEFCEQKC